MNRILEKWHTYRTEVIPLDAPAIQAQESRRAFYAGAQALVSILLDLDPGTEPTENDLQVMDDIQEELRQFVRDVVEGRA